MIIDSLDASVEGVGEKDSAKPSRAIAPILNIAHQADGPAFLVLGNTIKSGEHCRGSGVIEDRADISFEVRDATDLKPTGTKDWWLELPAAGVAAWAERASRRKRRDKYRLAFVASKFRVGEEPDPFVLEIDLSGEPWTMRDVTADVVAAGEAARIEVRKDEEERLQKAAIALRDEVTRRYGSQAEPFDQAEAEKFLMAVADLKRKAARELLKNRDGTHWIVRTDTSRRGHPRRLFPVGVDL